MPIPQPNGQELEILTLLWTQPEEKLPLKLGQIYDLVKERRQAYGEAAPAITTISSTLRSALARGILKAIRLTGGQKVELEPTATRSTLHASRSPQTGYKPAASPSETLTPMLEILAEAYGENGKAQALLDFAKALQFSDKTLLKKLKKLLEL